MDGLRNETDNTLETKKEELNELNRKIVELDAMISKLKSVNREKVTGLHCGLNEIIKANKIDCQSGKSTFLVRAPMGSVVEIPFSFQGKQNSIKFTNRSAISDNDDHKSRKRKLPPSLVTGTKKKYPKDGLTRLKSKDPIDVIFVKDDKPQRITPTRIMVDKIIHGEETPSGYIQLLEPNQGVSDFF